MIVSLVFPSTSIYHTIGEIKKVLFYFMQIIFLDTLVQYLQQLHDGDLSCWACSHDSNAHLEKRLRSVQQRRRDGRYGERFGR